MASIRLYSTVFDCQGALALSRFWAAALGWELRQQEPGWASVGDPDGTQRLGFGPVPEGKACKNRLHLDLLPEQGVNRAAERARLESLGARFLETVRADGVVAHDVMADPEGNEFCLLEPHPGYFAAE